MHNPKFKKAIDRCVECVSLCNHAAISALEGDNVQEMRKCIRISLECAIFCRVAAELLSLDSRFSKTICSIVADVCNACAAECEQHNNSGEWALCAEYCRACANELMGVYQMMLADEQAMPQEQLLNGNAGEIKKEECVAVARASAELITLSSEYAQRISALNVRISEAFVQETVVRTNEEIEHLKAAAKVAADAHQELLEEQGLVPEAAEKETKRKKKSYHSSALYAASMWRRPSARFTSHIKGDIQGSSDLANTGPIPYYE